MRTLTLAISGMSCGHCLNAVNKALSALPGVLVRGVQIGRAEVVYEPEVIEGGRLIAAVEAAGYEVLGSTESGEGA
jgi:copper chaperone CopZ